MDKIVFGKQYANIYDDLYEYKDYRAECDFLESLFKKNHIDVTTLLDLGCGTGGHLILLAQRGYSVTGVDASPAMLAIAREKAAQAGVTCDLACGDMRTITLGKRFDVVIAMFAVMSYMTTDNDIASALFTARKHTRPGGLFIFDVWYGPAVLAEKPEPKTKILHNGDHVITRHTDPVLDEKTHTVATRFHLVVEENKILLAEEKEIHNIRYFFVEEITAALLKAGFDTVFCCPFMAADGTLSAKTWNMTVVAK